MGAVSSYASARTCAYVVDASAGCTLYVHGFLAFFVIFLFAFNYCPWLSYYFWHKSGSTCACAYADVSCNLKYFVTFRTFASVLFFYFFFY